jgi:hypothetical protein
MENDEFTNTLGDLASLIQEKKLVVLAGAGISMAAPTSLPGWWDFNTAVLQAMADKLVEAGAELVIKRWYQQLLERRNATRAFTPDFMAQLMAEEVGADYFRVLQVLDSDRCNANHEVLADLAGAGLLRAIITTNFDRLIELALDRRGVPYRVFATPESFEQLAEVLNSADGPLPVIKAHGTVTDPTTMVDTLAQRVAGRPKSLMQAIQTLLLRSPCLILGFSGADLAYDQDYLALRPSAADGVGIIVIVRPGSTPLLPMQELVQVWAEKGRTMSGQLPEWLLSFRTALGVVPTPSGDPTRRGDETVTPDWTMMLAERCRAWADSLPAVSIVNMFTSLVDTNQDDETMLRYLMFFRRYYRRTEDQLSPTYWRYEYNFGKRLLERGIIGTIDPRQAGLIPDMMPGDVDAKDYADAFQFLGRGAREGNLIEGEANLIRYLALKLGHGHVRGNVKQLLERLETIEETNDLRGGFEILLLGTEFAEEFGNFGPAWEYIKAAYYTARELGDEIRRAICAARATHITTFLKQYELAEQQADEALRIAEHLSLPILRGDALASRGLIDVLRGYDGRAVGPLEEACAIFRGHQRRPRLTYALCDLGRAYYYSGAADKAMNAINEAKDLAEILPGLGVQVSLMELELLMAGEQWVVANTAAGELLEIATQCKHEYGINRAQKYMAEIATKTGGAGMGS